MFNLNNKISSILIFSIIFGSVEYIRGFILGGFPWNLVVFSLTEYLPMIQILSLVGTYSLNLLVISIFLIPSVIFLKYEKKMSGSSFKDRREMGVLWYPVLVDETKFDAGERLLVKVFRTPEHKQSHSFQSGKLVNLFLNNDTNSGDVNGVINQVKETHMVITLNCDEIPSWIERGGLGVKLLFDENTYREMEFALKFLIESIDPRLNDLKDKLLGELDPSFTEDEGYEVSGLNESQNKALRLVQNAENLAVIHGPPGTGKTTTMVEAIYQTLKSENQVMVCAPSNAAVDLLV